MLIKVNHDRQIFILFYIWRYKTCLYAACINTKELLQLAHISIYDKFNLVNAVHQGPVVQN